jgi:hypothetical protein
MNLCGVGDSAILLTANPAVCGQVFRSSTVIAKAVIG